MLCRRELENDDLTRLRPLDVKGAHTLEATSEDRMRVLIVLNSYSEIEFYYYLVAYVHTVYIHAN